MRRDSVVIAGYYGFGNAGDELILHSLVQEMRHENPDVSMTVLSKNPAKTKRQHGVEATDRWRPWHWIWPFLYADRLVLGGGGLLQESTGPWNHFYYLTLILLAKCFGCRCEVVAIGVDPIDGRFNRFWTRFILNHWTDAISVRDDVSRRAFGEVGILGPIAIRRDPVFELTVPTPVERPVGIALALSGGRDGPFPVHETAGLIDRLAQELLVPIDLLVFFPKQDESLAREITNLTSGIRRVIGGDNPQDLLSRISQYRLVVSTRYHALVLATTANLPFVGWGPQQKVKTLCESQGMPYCEFDDHWDKDEQFILLSGLYKSKDKSVILATRIG